MSELFRLVGAWQEAVSACKASYDATQIAMHEALAPVGGMATTTPNDDGYFTWFQMCRKEGGGGGWLVGAGRVPRDDAKFPDVGDRCLVLETAWREHAYRVSAARDALRMYIERVGGGTEPEHVALALYKERA